MRSSGMPVSRSEPKPRSLEIVQGRTAMAQSPVVLTYDDSESAAVTSTRNFAFDNRPAGVCQTGPERTLMP